MTAGIALTEDVRDLLKTFGHARMTYEQILTALMDRVERDDFMRELRKQYAATLRRDNVDLEVL